jgi:dTDP-4-dehydrorhamnose reductase
MLVALERGECVPADPLRDWDGTYGPDVADTVLDFLLDGSFGVLHLFTDEQWSEAQFAAKLAETADCSLDLVVPAARELRIRTSPGRDEYSAALLPPTATMLERLVREIRAARRHGGSGVGRRKDDTRLQAATPPSGRETVQ